MKCIAGAKVQLFRETSVYYKTLSQAQNHGNRGLQTILYCQITPKFMKNCSAGEVIVRIGTITVLFHLGMDAVDDLAGR